MVFALMYCYFMRSEDETEINSNWVNMSVLLEKYVVIDMILDELLCTEADCKSHAGGDDKLIFFFHWPNDKALKVITGCFYCFTNSKPYKIKSLNGTFTNFSGI